MNVREIIEFINRLEQNFPVTQWKIDDIDIWPLIRFRIYFTLYNKHEGIQVKTETIVSKFRKLAFLLLRESALSFYIFFKYPSSIIFRLYKCDALFVDNSSYILHNNMSYHRFCDPIIDDLNHREQKSLLLSKENINITDRHSPAYFINLKVKLHLFLKKFIPHRQKIYLPSFEEVQNILSIQNIGLPVIINANILKEATRIRIISGYFLNIIQKTTPQAIFLVSYYNVYGMALNYAAYRAGIKTIDLQHGTENDYHVGYGSWLNVPSQGYNTLPSCFACWDQSSVDCISKWSVGTPHMPYLFGNRYLEKIKNSSSNSFTNIFTEKAHAQTIKKHILLTLQHGFGLNQKLQEILKLSKDDYFWWIRLHPVMLSEMPSIFQQVKETNLKNFELEACSRKSLYEILPFMDVHITLNSSVVIEAAEFGVPSITCDATAIEYYSDMDLVTSILDPYQINHIIDNVRKMGVKSTTLSDKLYEDLGL